MRFDVISLFPEMFSLLRDQGVSGRAHAQGLWSLHTWNPRDFSEDIHRRVDDRPYGGGPGMVMQPAPLERAVFAAKAQRGDAPVPVVLLSPAGRPFSQEQALAFSRGSGCILVCGRYEGVDQRFIERCVTSELSLGDFVLSGGEIAALAVMDATVRLLPGVLGHAESAAQDSFQPGLSGLLDSPHYTRPENYEGRIVPEVLRSGDHARIERWRRDQSLRLTLARRPGLIEQARAAGLLTPEDEAVLSTMPPA
ncbi:MAG: tRNA (guanosine(37)-N1)-methyltransferase TrmD [Castellaniella sp.]